MRFFLTLIILCFSFSLQATETCSRVAIINYQEVLIDSNSSEKGENLRFYLEKDPIAKEYLDKYQKNSGIRWPSAVLGTAGTGLLLYGFFNSDSENRKIHVIAGTATLFVNFLLTRTLEMANEANLNRSIEEYNKRNLPKIFFNPLETQSSINFSDYKIGLVQQWTF